MNGARANSKNNLPSWARGVTKFKGTRLVLPIGAKEETLQAMQIISRANRALTRKEILRERENATLANKMKKVLMMCAEGKLELKRTPYPQSRMVLTIKQGKLHLEEISGRGKVTVITNASSFGYFLRLFAEKLNLLGK